MVLEFLATALDQVFFELGRCPGGRNVVIGAAFVNLNFTAISFAKAVPGRRILRY
jgi:hypothetical protein